MRCLWQNLMTILPPWLRQELEKMEAEPVQELRLRQNEPVELVIAGKSRWLDRRASKEDILCCVNAACRYSPWSAAMTSKGYITAPGGHRIGLCGEAVMKGGAMSGFREITSLNIRVARDIPGISKGIRTGDSLLIIGAPGWGKTTLLRDLIRSLSNSGSHVSVVDERCELFPEGGFPRGSSTDVLSCCRKGEGIDCLLRTMGPDWIAVDEITEAEDCKALTRAGFCGVKLLATAHAGSLRDLRTREVYRPILESRLFTTAVVLKQDKTWTQERMDL